MTNQNRHPEGAAGSMGGKFAPDPSGAQAAPVALSGASSHPAFTVRCGAEASSVRAGRKRLPEGVCNARVSRT